MRPSSEWEWIVLSTDPGRALLQEVTTVLEPGPADLSRWRQDWPAEVVAAAVRLAAGRRRATNKFTRADRMWLEPTALEQATAESVARHKARRFARTDGVVVDLCCGIGGDALAIGPGATVIAVDRDAAMVRRACWNARVYEVGDRVAGVCAQAERFPIPEGSRVHIDPDRRRRLGRRAMALKDYEPGLAFLRELAERNPGGAIKLGPASDFEACFGGEGFEVELVSLGGECKEATVWFGDLSSCRRRATNLPSGATWTEGDGRGGSAVGTVPLANWVFEPDPALVRAGLLDGFAAAHGLARLASGVDLLTGGERRTSPFLTTFAVEEILPMDLKRLRRRVAERRLGPLEIKTRALDRTPEAIRRELRPTGPNPGTLLLIGSSGRERARAILARRD